MPFFEGTIIRARGADDVGDRPAVTGRDASGWRGPRRAVLPSSC